MQKNILTDAHRFWFGELKGPDDYPAKDVSERWFRRSDALDAEIRERFGPHIAPAAEEAWNLPELTREQAIGLVIMLDQFTRNIFRDSGESFARDARAREIASALIDAGTERFYPAERAFLYMPLMHSEHIADQDRCAALFAGETLAARGDDVERFRNYLDFAFLHRSLIRKFGRFPHRNEVLGRASTDEEKTFLAEKGRGF